jgi:hypothetical protein
MKNNNILIAAATIIFIGAGFANAGETAVPFDFDGRGIGARNFMETIKDADSCRNDSIACEQLHPAPVSLTDEGTPVAVKAKSAAVRLAPALTPRTITAMDESIGSAIAYVNTHGLGPQLRPGFECLRAQGTPEEKSAFVYAAEGTNYTLPDKCTRQDTKGTCTCVAWDYRDVCHDTSVIEDVCTVVAGVCAAGYFVGGVWTVPECTASYMICKAVSVIKQICVPTKYCSQQSNCGPTFG